MKPLPFSRSTGRSAIFVKCFVLAALFGLFQIKTRAQDSADQPGYTVLQRGPNETIYQVLTTNFLDDGSIIIETNRLTQLENGLNYFDEATETYVPAEELIEVADDGSLAFAIKGQQKVIFSNNVNDPEGAIDLIGPGGERIRASVLSLVYFDPISGNDVTLAVAKDTPAELVPPNQIIFRDAFDNILADVVYTYRRSGLEQDVILRQKLPDPQEFGFPTELAQLQVISEFFQVPGHQVNKRVRPLVAEEHLRALLAEPDWIDDELDFGSFKIGQGHAFTIGGPDGAVPERLKSEVAKRWWLLENRYILAESVEYVDILPLFSIFDAGNVQKQNNPGETYGPLLATLLGPPTGTFERAFPHRSLAAVPAQAITVASSFTEMPGIVIDYLTVSGTQTSYTFAGDTVYNITGDMTITTCVIEGGAILKLSPGKKLRITGTLDCQTAMYRPAIVTSRNDNTIGENVPLSTGTPAKGDYSIALEIAPSSAGTFKVSNIRFLYAQTGVHYAGPNGGTVEIWNCQAVKCNVPFSGAFDVAYKLRNVLADDFNSLLYASGGYLSVNGQHVTAHKGTTLGTSVYYGTFINSLFTEITGNSLVNYAGAGTPSILPSASGIFQTQGSGFRYLAENSPYRNYGTSIGLDSTLSTDLKLRTTYPPVVLTANFTTPTVLSPRGILDNDSARDIGYHYDPIDYSWTALQTTTSLTLTNGVRIGFYGHRGLTLASGGKLFSGGTPTNPNRIVRYQNVQEQPQLWGTTPTGFFDLGSYSPEVRFTFTEFVTLAGSALQRRLIYSTGSGFVNPFAASHCYFKNFYSFIGNTANASGSIYAFTNNVFERCDLTWNYDSMYYPVTLYLYNNLFHKGKLSLTSSVQNSAPWTIKDNFINVDVLTQSSYGYSAVGNNAYKTGLGSLGGTGNILNIVADFQPGPLSSIFPLGSFYYPTTGTGLAPLINAGSRTYDAADLYHFTVKTASNTKEGNDTLSTLVDIGFHHVAVGSDNLPIDTDADGTFDYENTGLIGHWRFDEITGSTANDSSGRSQHGTLFNAPVWSDGMRNGGIFLSGANDYVQVSDHSSLKITGNLTIAFWFKKASDATTSPRRLIGKGTSTLENYSIWEDAGSGSGRKIRFRQRNSSGGNVVDLVSVKQLMANYWIHIAVVVNGSTASLYLDGVLQGTATRTGTPATSTDALKFGYPGFDGPFPGGLDDIRIFNRALSTSEVAALAYVENRPPSVTFIPSSKTATLIQDAQGNPTVTINFDNFGTDDDWPRVSNPYPGHALDISFNQSFGPGPVTATAQVHASATFTVPGDYILQYKANDGQLWGYGDLPVRILPLGTQNTAPIVNAGPDKSIPMANPLTAVPFATSTPATTIHNNLGAWIGTKFLVGSDPLVVTELGRWVLSGNSGTHTLKLVNASTGLDVASTTINTAGKPAGQFAYAPLNNHVILSPNTTYYLVSQETYGGDQWYNSNCILTSGGAVTFQASIYNTGSSYQTAVTGSYCYGPLNLKHSKASTPLEGTVLDDGLPVGGTITTSWSVIDTEPDGLSVTFSDDGKSPTSIATFSKPGRYNLRLTANDGIGLDVSDDVIIRAYANERRPKDVILVFDRSLPAPPQPLYLYAQHRASDLTKLLEEGIDQAGLIVFSGASWLQHVLSYDLESVRGATHTGESINNATAAFEMGIRLAQFELTGPRRNPKADPVMVIFSDGINGGLVNPPSTAVQEAVRNAKAAGITIICLGIYPENLPAPGSLERDSAESYLKALSSDPTYFPVIKTGAEILSNAQDLRVLPELVDRLLFNTTFDKKVLSVSAGQDIAIMPAGSKTLQASPSGGVGPYTYYWTKLSGPENVTFTPNNHSMAESTIAGFGSTQGDYVLRVLVVDSSTPPLSGIDDIVAHVTSGPAPDYFWVNKRSSETILPVLQNDPDQVNFVISGIGNEVTLGSTTITIVDMEGNPANGNGKKLKYIPDPHLGAIPHRFKYFVNNNPNGAEVWVVTNPINEPPFAIPHDTPDDFSFSPGSQTGYSLTSIGRHFLCNDWDPDFGERRYETHCDELGWAFFPFTMVNLGEPVDVLTGAPAGRLQVNNLYDIEFFPPDPPFNGIVEFEYTIRDTYGFESSTTEKLYVSVGANEKRYKAFTDAESVSASSSFIIIDVLENDLDFTGASAPGIDSWQTINPAVGTISLETSGSRPRLKMDVNSLYNRAQPVQFTYKIFGTSNPDHQAIVYIGFDAPSGQESQPIGSLSLIDNQDLDAQNPPAVRKGFVTVTGTADDSYQGNIIAYQLKAITFSGDVTVAESPVYYQRVTTEGLLGELDLRKAPDGMYRLELLIAQDGRPDYAGTDVKIYGYFLLQSELKLGRLRFETMDLEVPLAGIPLRLGRSYDTGDVTQGDFGPAWRLTMGGARLLKADILGDHWVPTMVPHLCGSADSRHLVTVDLGNGQRFQFRPILNGCSGGGLADDISFTQVSGDPGAVLHILNPPNQLEFFTYDTEDGRIEVSGTPEKYDPEDFEFIHPDGSVYTFQNSYLLALEDRNGNSLKINLGGQVKTIVYDRAGVNNNLEVKITTDLVTGEITSIQSPAEDGTTIQTVIYEYTEHSGQKYLTKVRRLVDKTQPNDLKYEAAVYQYPWQDGISIAPSTQKNYDHYITQIKDDVGIVSRYHYDEEGRLKASLDGTGNRTSFDYHDEVTVFYRGVSKGRQTIIDPLGNKTIHEYDDRGNIVLTRDALGNDTTHDYTYDNDRVATDIVNKYAGDSTIQVPPLPVLLEGPITTTYGYHGATDTVATRSVTIPGPGSPATYSSSSTYDSYGQLTGTTDANGNVTTYNYVSGTETPSTDYVNAKGKILEIIHPSTGTPVKTTYKYPSNQIIETDPLGNKTTTQLDPNFGWVNSVLKEDNTGLDLSYVAYTYTAEGLVETEKNRRALPGYTGVFEELRKTYTYDRAGRQLSVSTAIQYFTTLTGSTPATPSPTPPPTTHPSPPTFTYTPRGQVKTETTTRTLPSGGTEGLTTSYEYDQAGNLIRKHYPDGEFEEWQYITGNRLDRFIDRAGRVTEYRFDALGRNIETLLPDKTSRKTEYDAAGRVKSTTDAGGHTMVQGYNTAGRRTSVTSPLLEATQYTYDAVGNVQTITDAKNRITTHQYNNRNLLKRIIYHDQTERNYTYDNNGQRITETDPEGMTTRYQYDGLGRLKSVTLAYGWDDAATTSYGYDEAGNMISQTDAKSNVTSFRYDAFGRRTKRVLPDGGAVSEDFTYDDLGNLRTRKDFIGRTTTFEYDKMNRLVKKIPDPTLNWEPVIFTYTASGQRATMKYPVGSGAGNTELVTYHYDSMDRLVKKLTPQGMIQYAFDSAGNLSKILTFHGTPASPTASLKLTYEYDALNRVKRVIDDTVATGRTTTYDYDEIGNLESYRLPNSQRVDLKYDELNRLDNIEHTTGSQIARFDYTVSATGTRRALSEYIQGFGSRNITWQYDQLYRLARETISGVGPAGSVTYDPQPGYSDSTGYEPNGNRRDRAVALSPTVSGFNSRSYTYNSKDCLTTVGDNYDANGNTTSSSDLGGTFAYNFEDRLISRTGGGLPSITIVYDGDGNRIRKTVGSTTTHYLVDDRNLTGYAQVLEETSTLNGTTDRYYVYGLDLINQHRKVGSSWETRYFGYDGQGSVRFLTDHPASGSAQITDRYTFDAFGTLIWTSGNTPNNYRYTGEQFDLDLNLYYLRARFFNPNTGRFFNSDTFEGAAFDPSTLHKFSYCAADPVNRIDPSGHDSLIGLSVGSSISGSLSGIYNGSVVGVGNAIQATLFGVQAGQAADDILKDFVLDETGIGLVIDGYNKVKSFFQSDEEAEMAAYMAWQEQLIATIFFAMEENEFGEITIEFVPQCFAAGTPVATSIGLKSIEEIRVGDKVWAWNEASEEVTLRPVLNCFVHRRNEIFEIQAGRDTFKVTGEHPFYVLGKGWTATRDIQVGDLFVTDDTEPLAVEGIEKHQGEFLVYNIEVSTDHNYYVGEEGVLTHNANALRKAMRLNNPLLAAHHIVALRANGAHLCRQLLLAPGTGIVNLDDVRNGVALPRNLKVKPPRGFARATVHSVVHTERYYRELQNRLQQVAPGQRVRVLRRAARELRIGKFPY